MCTTRVYITTGNWDMLNNKWLFVRTLLNLIKRRSVFRKKNLESRAALHSLTFPNEIIDCRGSGPANR